MTNSTALVYRLVTEEDIDTVRPLWEQLRDYHARLPWRFAGEMHRLTFEPRKQEILGKAAVGKVRIELVRAGPDKADIAYCVSTLSERGMGEIDSIFVDPRFRGRGIGSELIRHALAWLESLGASSKVVSVAHANEEALALYKRFGFHPRTVLLQQSHNEPA